MGNCIGLRNYPLFLGFIAAASLFTAYVCAFSVVELALLARMAQRAAGGAPGGAHAPAKQPYALRTDTALGAFFEAVTQCPTALVLAIYTAIVVALLAMLGAYHVYLVSVNETTNENVKDAFYEGNPFSESCARNWGKVFCALSEVQGTELGRDAAAAEGADARACGVAAEAADTPAGPRAGGEGSDQPLPPVAELDVEVSARQKRYQATLRRLSVTEVELGAVGRGARAGAPGVDGDDACAARALSARASSEGVGAFGGAAAAPPSDGGESDTSASHAGASRPLLDAVRQPSPMGKPRGAPVRALSARRPARRSEEPTSGTRAAPRSADASDDDGDGRTAGGTGRRAGGAAGAALALRLPPLGREQYAELAS